MRTPRIKHHLKDLHADPVVVRARHKEKVRDALKLFRLITDAVRRHKEWVEARHGLTAPELWAVWELEQTPGLRAVDLAKAMTVHRADAETLLNGLTARGLVVRQSLAEEQAAGYSLTEAGKQLVQAIPDHAQGVLKASLDQLPDGILDQIVDALGPLVENLPFKEGRAAHRPMAELLQQTPPHPEHDLLRL